jgi:hypothetical protein
MGDQFDVLLSEFSPKVGEISNALRSMIREIIPDGNEQFDQTQKHLSYSLSNSMESQVILLSPKKDYVFVVFRQCKHLDDPANLIGGDGKQARFMTVRTIEDAQKPAVKDLIKSAWENARNQASQPS